ncbi:expressed unknown protein [Seminavis robusta]|uniref:Uncharacterized protein n=1 Tax=Seminavis robusta TaxID=568900 RepID=A0A9N8DAQ1_9STRA|nr:expressed unknown protein [Seminavis robusta]|eukprot:Sro67_g037740.1 n/a (265) ;mRNA; r:109445-110239
MLFRTSLPVIVLVVLALVPATSANGIIARGSKHFRLVGSKQAMRRLGMMDGSMTSSGSTSMMGGGMMGSDSSSSGMMGSSMMSSGSSSMMGSSMMSSASPSSGMMGASTMLSSSSRRLGMMGNNMMMTTTDSSSREGGAESEEESNEECPKTNKPTLEPDTICNVLQVFDNMGRGENRDGALNWPRLCDDFESVDPYLCPSGSEIDAICSHINPQLNQATKIHYCSPLFDDLPDGAGKDKCVRICINYVSKNRGNCCGFDCGPP